MKSIEKLLTRKVHRRLQARERERVVVIPPSRRLLLAFQFSLILLTALVILQALHLLVLGAWNSQIFSALTGVAGTLLGVLLERGG